MTAPSLKIGILGTARIIPTSILKPVSKNPLASVEALASENSAKAQALCKKFHIPKLYSSYEDLLQDQTLDAVYIPLPNHLHCKWTLLALSAGKHVLCEKPLASNANDAQAMMDLAHKKNLVLMEAFHYRFHPFALRLKEIVTSGEIGKIQQIEASQNWWFFGKNDNCFQYDLSGGVLMGTGCYLIDAIHFIMNDKLEVVDAKARLIKDQIDHTMGAHLKLQSKIPVEISCSLRTYPWNWRSFIKITGDQGTLLALLPFIPHVFNLLRIKSPTSSRYEFFNRKKSTYDYQLSYFLEAIHSKKRLDYESQLSINNLKVIDQIYTAAGLKKRGMTD